jgi:hypothetical protein
LSPLLDISTLELEKYSGFWAPGSGYLDLVLTVFQRHNHPIILVTALMMRVSGSNNLPRQKTDMLVRSSDIQAFVDGPEELRI